MISILESIFQLQSTTVYNENKKSTRQTSNIGKHLSRQTDIYIDILTSIKTDSQLSGQTANYLDRPTSNTDKNLSRQTGNYLDRQQTIYLDRHQSRHTDI